MSFCKPCNGCDEQIFIIQINGKNRSYDDQLGTCLHKCIKNKNRNLSKSPDIQDDLRIIFHILDSHSMQLEKIVNDINELRIKNE